MINASSKEANSLFGRIVMDFANSEESTEACLSLIKHLRFVYGFNEDSVTQAKTAFPTLDKIALGLSKAESELFYLLWEFHNASYRISFSSPEGYLNYDGEKECFHIFTQEQVGHDPTGQFGDYFEDKITQVTVKQARDILLKHNPGKLEDFDIFMRIKRQVSKFSSSMPQERYDEILSIFNQSGKINDGHCQIASFQEDLKLLLAGLARKRNLSQSKIIREFIKDYSHFLSPKLEISEDGIIIEAFPLKQDSFLEELKLTYGSPVPSSSDWHEKYISFMFNCLIKLLISKKNIQLIKLCIKCQKFYFAKTLRKEQRFCSKKCRLDSHNRRRIDSGEHAKYKRERKEAGKATASYYG